MCAVLGIPLCSTPPGVPFWCRGAQVHYVLNELERCTLLACEHALGHVRAYAEITSVQHDILTHQHLRTHGYGPDRHTVSTRPSARRSYHQRESRQ